MPIVQPAAPGVYLIEPPPAVPSQVLTATTSVAAFPGVFPTGPVGEAVLVSSWDDFAGQYGGLGTDSSLAAFAVWQFFQNGGTSAYIVRLDSGAMTHGRAKIGGVVLTALTPGASGNGMLVTLQASSDPGAGPGSVDLVVTAPDGTILETITGLPDTPAQLAPRITAKSSYFSAGLDPVVKTPFEPPLPSVQFASTNGGAPTAEIGGLILTAISTWQNDVAMSLAVPVSGAKGAVDVVIMQKGKGSKAATLDRLYDVRTDSRTDMADDLGDSPYLTVTYDPTKAWTAPAPTVGHPVAVTIQGGKGVISGGAVAFTLVATPPWENRLTAQLTPVAPAPGKTEPTIDLVLTSLTPTGPALVEQLTGLIGPTEVALLGAAGEPEGGGGESDAAEAPTPAAAAKPKPKTDPMTALAAAITAASNFVGATVDASPKPGVYNPPFQFPPPPQTVRGGTDGTWNTAELKSALLTQFGDAPLPPAPVPALDQIAPNVFNLMCLPDVTYLDQADQVAVLSAAQTYCQEHQAFLIVDTPAPVGAPASPLFRGPPPSLTVPPLADDVARQTFLRSTWKTSLFNKNAFCGAAYYPWVTIDDPRPTPGAPPLPVPPSGTVAGVYASTDASRGVWKAPAGVNATLTGVLAFTDKTMNDTVNGDLNGSGINCLRQFNVYGNIVWGARTMAGADPLQSGWKYVPIRRTADFIEQSLLRSLKWVVFEPNEPPLWASITLEVTAFMNSLFGQGAFNGTTAAQAYQVVCDATTTSPADQLAGVVNVFVGFQGADPAEFVVLTVQLNAGAPAGS